MISNEEFFIALYEKLSIRLASEHLFTALYESAVHTGNQTFLSRLFRSPTSHLLYSSLTGKQDFIEGLLLFRGELQQHMEPDPKTFEAVYRELALQPYAPWFFQTFPQVINSAGDEDPALLAILDVARDQMTD